MCERARHSRRTHAAKLLQNGRMSSTQADNMKKLLKYLGWLAKLAVFVLVLGFALKNTHLVSVASYLGYSWQLPLIVMLLLAFLLGALIGLLALLPYLFRLRRLAASRPPVTEARTMMTDIPNV